MRRPEIIELQHILHDQGLITVAENSDQLPFQINRVYWLTEVPEGQIRGNNASLKGERILICIQGEAKIDLEDLDGNKQQFIINNPSKGLYIPNLYWSKIEFSRDTLVICLVSNTFSDEDYIRSYEDFLRLK